MLRDGTRSSLAGVIPGGDSDSISGSFSANHTIGDKDGAVSPIDVDLNGVDPVDIEAHGVHPDAQHARHNKSKVGFESTSIDVELERSRPGQDLRNGCIDEVGIGYQSHSNVNFSSSSQGAVNAAIDHLRRVARDHSFVSTANERTRRRSGLMDLYVEFPDADRGDIGHLEKVLNQDARYLLSAPATLQNFLKRNLDCSEWKSDQKRAGLRTFSGEDLIVLLLLSIALLLSTPARSHLNSLSGLMILSDTELEYSAVKHGQLLYVGAVACAVGKICTGFIIDLSDPLNIFGMFCVLSAAMVLLISELHEFTVNADATSRNAVLQVLFGFNVFFQSGIFASGLKFLYDHFRPAQYGRSLTIFAAGGRLGSIISTLVMGSLVSDATKAQRGWQQGSRIAAYMCLSSVIPLVLIRCFPHPAPHLAATDETDYNRKLGHCDAPAPPVSLVKRNLPWCNREHWRKDKRRLMLAAKRVISWWQRPAFMLMACANAGMAVVIATEGFDGISPLFAVNSIHVPPGLDSASVVVFMHIGAILSLLLGGSIVERLPRPAQARVVLVLIFVACCAIAGMSGVVAAGGAMDPTIQSMALAPGMRTVMFFIGFGMGYPFFVTVPKFALYFGGQNSALVAQCLSLFALAVCAVANSIFGVLVSKSYTVMVIILLIAPLMSLTCMMWFDFIEWRQKKKKRQAELEEAVIRILTPKRHQSPFGESADVLAADGSFSRGNHNHHHDQGYSHLRRDDCHFDTSSQFDHREDAAIKNGNNCSSWIMFGLVSVVIVALFLSYYWSQNPDMFVDP